MKREQTGGQDDTSVYVPANKLGKPFKMALFHVACETNNDNPKLAKVAGLSVDLTVRVLETAFIGYEVHIGNIERSIQRTFRLARRDLLYKNLLLAGAPKEMLGQHFSKTRREIELDRKKEGIRAVHAGRPPALESDLAYEILGHWEVLCEDIHDYAECIYALHLAFPTIAVTSLHALVKEK